MNQKINLGSPYMSDTQATHIHILKPVLPGTVVNAKGEAITEPNKTAYGIAGEYILKLEDSSYIQTIYTNGHIYGIKPEVEVSNIHIVKDINEAIAIDENNTPHTVNNAAIIKL